MIGFHYFGNKNRLTEIIWEYNFDRHWKTLLYYEATGLIELIICMALLYWKIQFISSEHEKTGKNKILKSSILSTNKIIGFVLKKENTYKISIPRKSKKKKNQKGALRVELRTYRSAVDCSATELYPLLKVTGRKSVTYHTESLFHLSIWCSFGMCNIYSTKIRAKMIEYFSFFRPNN